MQDNIDNHNSHTCGEIFFSDSVQSKIKDATVCLHYITVCTFKALHSSLSLFVSACTHSFVFSVVFVLSVHNSVLLFQTHMPHEQITSQWLLNTPVETVQSHACHNMPAVLKRQLVV